jgi:hypothetical protein
MRPKSDNRQTTGVEPRIIRAAQLGEKERYKKEGSRSIGGGILNDGTLTINNSTVSGNSALSVVGIAGSATLQSRPSRSPCSESAAHTCLTLRTLPDSASDTILATIEPSMNPRSSTSKERTAQLIKHLQHLAQARDAYEQATTASAKLRATLDAGDASLRSLMTQIERVLDAPVNQQQHGLRE